MPRTKMILKIIVAFCCIALLSRCYKNKTVYLEPEITRSVTFSQDIIPLFNKNCNTSGCHSAGGQTPNLTETNAYNSLIIGNYVNKTDPENSLIYLKMTGKHGTPMPPSGSNKDLSALMLAWIKQGANNN